MMHVFKSMDKRIISKLNDKSIVQEQKKRPESKYIQIISYEPKYKAAFKDLNVAWISKYFELEDADFKVLDNPERAILDQGGSIYIALYKDIPVGVCGLKKMHDSSYDYEVVKMAVSPQAQGKGIGWLLGQKIVQAAKALGAKKIYLEGNTKLEASIHLYRKLGFREITSQPSPYKRVNIQMELRLDNLQER